MSDNRHAIESAKASLEGIREIVKRLTDAADDNNFELEDNIRQEINEEVLSVQIRGGWHNPGANSTPEEFEILLSTGGPACRIIGDLNQYGEPDTARIQWQDWGTPWTDLHASEFGCEPDEADLAVAAYARTFYFGEG